MPSGEDEDEGDASDASPSHSLREDEATSDDSTSLPLSKDEDEPMSYLLR